MSQRLRDWTQGGEGIVYQRCPTCDAVWYIHRDFCPRCGKTGPQTLQASGRGTVHATSLVHRAPTEALKALTPYLIVLVDAEEGFRMMAHGARSLSIGERASARFVRFGEAMVPFFERT